LMRGSWGKGFRAPTLVDMYGDTSSTNLNSPPAPAAGLPGGDRIACEALTAVRADPLVADNYQPYPVNPCTTNGQYQWMQTSNTGLEPEESKNWGAGVVWSPTDAMSFALDYYDVEIENVISTVPRALAFEYGNQGLPLYGVVRTAPIIAPNGTPLPGVPNEILLPTINGAKQTSRGLDFEANYRLDTGIGTFASKLTWSHVLEYDYTPVSSGVNELAGTAGYPENRGQLVLGWSKGDFSTSVITNYIDGSSNPDPDEVLPSWTTFDFQASVSVPWNAKITIGVRNVGNKMPPFNDSLYGFPFYDNSIYNIYGRVPYMRYEQNF
ncbi:MAG TPA: TonB-dependent receptor, partial [Pseudoxanthomonas sp.]|nr:TonB-dependent receptor [Pseudoxanthomonas sp.]